MQEVRAITRQFKGMNLLVPPETLPPEMFLVDQNGDRRRGLSWRVRPGYRRLFSGVTVPARSTVFGPDNFEATYGYGIANPLWDHANFTERTNSPNGTYGLYVFGSGANSAVWGERDLLDTAGILLAELTGTYDDDQYAEAAAYSRATSTDTAILLAVRSSASGAYLLENRDDDHIRIGKTTHADDFTELADSGVISINDNDVMRLEVLGSTITAYLNDVAILSVVDTTFTTGKPGLGHRLLGALEVGDGTWDDFEAGDLVSAGVPVKALGAPRHLLAFERDDNEAQLLVSSPGAVEAFETGTPEGV